jgi:hypothetical protein
MFVFEVETAVEGAEAANLAHVRVVHCADVLRQLLGGRDVGIVDAVFGWLFYGA